MAADVSRLLEPVSGDDPVGPDLAYDDERVAIEQAFEVSAGGEGTSDADINWRDIVKMIEGQCGRTKDLWLAVYLARAGARSGQLDVIDRGAQLLAGLVETYWDKAHPDLEEYGFQGRKGACESLTRIGDFLGPLRRTPLIQHPRLGSFSGADFERFHTNGDSEDGYGLFRAAMADTSVDDFQAVLDRLDSIRDGIRRADQTLTANAEGDTSTNFQTTYEAIAQVRRALAAFSGTEGDEPAASDVDDAAAPSGGGSASAPAASRAPGSVESREDVLRALDTIADYYRRREPSSPVPLLLRRARGWVNLDFMEMIRDIAPDTTPDFRKILMSPSEEE